ncbi:hypothetical protein ACFWNL_34160 [Kitasatospora sp. NPDC058397]|uniref:hypothetical protein n=1 Tax=unclassified Kitasatospora TaxID=2633591 RepID=UPI003651D1B2
MPKRGLKDGGEQDDIQRQQTRHHDRRAVRAIRPTRPSKPHESPQEVRRRDDLVGVTPKTVQASGDSTRSAGTTLHRLNHPTGAATSAEPAA